MKRLQSLHYRLLLYFPQIISTVCFSCFNLKAADLSAYCLHRHIFRFVNCRSAASAASIIGIGDWLWVAYLQSVCYQTVLRNVLQPQWCNFQRLIGDYWCIPYYGMAYYGSSSNNDSLCEINSIMAFCHVCIRLLFVRIHKPLRDPRHPGTIARQWWVTLDGTLYLHLHNSIVVSNYIICLIANQSQSVLYIILAVCISRFIGYGVPFNKISANCNSIDDNILSIVLLFLPSDVIWDWLLRLKCGRLSIRLCGYLVSMMPM